MSFQEKMLDQTFELSRLALNNAVLLNGAAASALLAFLGLAAPPARGPLTTAVIWFGCGAGLGGLASVLAYLGQRCNWEYSKNESLRRNWKLAADLLLWPATIVCLASFAVFARGAAIAARSL